MTDYESAVRVTARMLIENRDRMYRHQAELTAAARARGHDIDTRIQYAEGSAAAYSIACSILAGACGVGDVAQLAGTDWRPTRDPLPPMLPDPDAHAFAPGDAIAAATVVTARMTGKLSDDGEEIIPTSLDDEIARALGDAIPSRHPDDVSTYGPVADAEGDFVDGVDFRIGR